MKIYFWNINHLFLFNKTNATRIIRQRFVNAICDILITSILSYFIFVDIHLTLRNRK